MDLEQRRHIFNEKKIQDYWKAGAKASLPKKDKAEACLPNKAEPSLRKQD